VTENSPELTAEVHDVLKAGPPEVASNWQ